MVKMSACHAVRSGFNSRHVRKNSYIAQRFRVLHCHCRGRGFDPRYNCENWFIGQMAKMSGCRPVRRGFESLIDRERRLLPIHRTLIEEEAQNWNYGMWTNWLSRLLWEQDIMLVRVQSSRLNLEYDVAVTLLVLIQSSQVRSLLFQQKQTYSLIRRKSSIVE